MTRILSLILACACGSAFAADCGGEVACEVDGGVYHALVPEAPPRGAVLFLHGYRGTSSGVTSNEELADDILDRGYAVVAPSGMPIEPGSDGGRWNARASEDWRDDTAFLLRVADDAAARFGLPRDQILAAGFSGGGMMVWRVACDAPDAFAAYAPVAGLMWRPLPDECAGPVRLHHAHGWSDTVVPIEGRSFRGGRITQGDLFQGLDLMRTAAGCRRDDPDAYDRDGETLIRAWHDCAPGAEIVLSLHPGGHMVPPGWSERALDWFEAEPPSG